MSSDSGVVDLHALQDELAQRAGTERSGRAARTLPHPVDGLRQTVIALRGGAELSEHESPGPASLLVIRGRVRVVAGERTRTAWCCSASPSSSASPPPTDGTLRAASGPLTTRFRPLGG
jgi:hypothetical protein